MKVDRPARFTIRVTGMSLLQRVVLGLSGALILAVLVIGAFLSSSPGAGYTVIVLGGAVGVTSVFVRRRHRSALDGEQ
jgi:hypothetical protein